MKIIRNFPLKKFTTMAIGGPAKFFVVAKTERDLEQALVFARKSRLPWSVVGEGSNLIVSDRGFRGVIIQNKIEKLDLSRLRHPPQAWGGKGRGRNVTVGAGNNLLNFILQLNRAGLSGLERMAGVPGTVGGAIYGCAGAYGQEIKDHLVSVRFWDGRKFRNLSRRQCQFSYRSSVFKKHKNWIIVSATFRLELGNSKELLKISRDTIKLRKKKYWPGLKCPGSFFKNILASEIKVPTELKNSIIYGKLPAGVLLERIGAKGMHQGRIRVAEHHANLIYNPGGGMASDVKKLAGKLQTLVKKKFGIIIDEEVQYI